jgi:hypothetical protein
MQPILIHSARVTWLGYLFSTLVSASIGAALITTNVSSLWGWACIVVSCAGTVATVRQRLDRRPRITIDDNGIVDRRLRYGLIEWDDIQGAYLRRDQVSTFVCLQLRNSKKYTDRLPPMVQRLVGLNAVMGETPVSMDVTGTDTKPEEIVDLIEKEIRTRSSARAIDHT